MLPRLEYIKQARLRLGITQRKLASLSGISTSMINQIESGRCKPSYDTARRIFEILTSLEEQPSMRAGDICSKKLIYMAKSDSLHDAIELMHKHSVSQIPVFDTSKVVGLISEDGVVKHMVEKEEGDLKNMRVDDVMEPPPPIVDVMTPARALVPLVRFSKCVLVNKRGNMIGIITVSDTLKMVE
ncbi:MAG: CBS domain-containing protein [Nitrososphaerales archaeon]